MRPYQRFKPATLLHSGVNPNGNFLSFTQKDVIKNIDIRAENGKRALSDLGRIELGRVPIGTTTCTYRMGLDSSAKLDRIRHNISFQ